MENSAYGLYSYIEEQFEKITSRDVAWYINCNDPLERNEWVDVHIIVGDDYIHNTYEDDWQDAVEELKPLIEKAKNYKDIDYVGDAYVLHNTIKKLVENGIDLNTRLITLRNKLNK